MDLIDLLCLLVVIGTTCRGNEGVVKLVAIAGSDVVLPCSLGADQNIESAVFDWKADDRRDVFLYHAGIHYSNGYPGQDEQFRGRVFHFSDELTHGNASIVIRKTRLSDTGNYSCIFPFLQRQKFRVELFVGATPKPRVMILKLTKDQALLHCEVRGAFPKPQMKWLDSDGNILLAVEKFEDLEDLYNTSALTLQTNVTKTGRYQCVLTQQELNHVTKLHIDTHIGGDDVNGILGKIIGSLVAVTILVVLVSVLIILFCLRRMRGGVLEKPVYPPSLMERDLVLKDAQRLRDRDRVWKDPKYQYPLRAERSDSGVSSLRSSPYPEKPENTRECVEPLELKHKPDEHLKPPEPQKMDSGFSGLY